MEQDFLTCRRREDVAKQAPYIKETGVQWLDVRSLVDKKKKKKVLGRLNLLQGTSIKR